MLQLDFTGVQSFNNTPLPMGVYGVRVKNVSPKTAKTGNPKIVWHFEVMEGEYEGRSIFHNTMNMKQSMWTIQLVLIALGYDEEEVAGHINLDPADLIGLECYVTLTQKTLDNGTQTGRVVNECTSFMTVTDFRNTYQSGMAEDTEFDVDDDQEDDGYIEGTDAEDILETATSAQEVYEEEEDDDEEEEEAPTVTISRTAQRLIDASDVEIDLDELTATGANNTVLKKDVLAWLEENTEE